MTARRERMCPWSISQAEAQLDPAFFVRVHRSHIVAIPHVTFVRKEGDGAVVELDGAAPHRVPVSRAKIAELKARLGVAGAGKARILRHVLSLSKRWRRQRILTQFVRRISRISCEFPPLVTPAAPPSLRAQNARHSLPATSSRHRLEKDEWRRR